jgi:hypothetical protein
MDEGESLVDRTLIERHHHHDAVDVSARERRDGVRRIDDAQLDVVLGAIPCASR